MPLRVRLGLAAALLASLACSTAARAGDPAGGPLGLPLVGAGEGELPAPPGGAGVAVLAGVPSYTWYHGCGPTSLGMMLGYWDARGFPELIPGANDWETNRPAIEEAIASPGHIRDYVPMPDRTPTPDDPYHADDCIADFCGASRDPLKPGWSYYGRQDDGLCGWALHCGYASTSRQLRFWELLWEQLVAAVDAGEPVELLVDTDGNNETDHFVCAIGYDSTPGELKYACYNTWDRQLHWYAYERMRTDQPWGVYGGTFFRPIPEPACLGMLLWGAAAVLIRRRR